jgi:tripartite-type tricarboxylate transporter receptor subunit TctC
MIRTTLLAALAALGVAAAAPAAAQPYPNRPIKIIVPTPRRAVRST